MREIAGITGTRQRLTGIGLVLLGIGSAVSSLLGPLGFGLIDWRISDNMENQIIGGDAVNLVIAALALAAGWLVWHGRRLGQVLVLAPALYSLYTWPQYILVPDYSRYDGNNETFIPLYIALTLLAWLTGLAAWGAVREELAPDIPHRLQWTLATLFLLAGGLFALTWTTQIAGVLGGELTTGYQEHPTAFWLVKLMDLAFVIPLLLATAVGLLRNLPFATRAALALSGFLAALGGAVSAMGIVMLVRDDPSATVVLPAITIPVSLGVAIATALLYRSWLRRAEVTGSDTAPAQRAPTATRRSEAGVVS